MLFGYRIPPLLLTVMLGLVILTSSMVFPRLYPFTFFVLAATVLLTVMGILFAVLGVISFRKRGTTVNPIKLDQATALVASGVYRVSRNPMYVGFLLVLTALTVYSGNILSMILVVLFFLYMNFVQIASEESALARLFGLAYNEYKTKVRRWL
ncbi:MAG: isoprenylcysteine carboxylmethyltransferase family protein [Alcanivoracaceae bacterium]|nr:isoprenylcysteine carboxylmethyltransferase family protein [Alcanivoracaceae bacterium]